MMSDASPVGSAAHAGGDKPGTGRFWALALGSIGVVFGDIGTSPLYAFKESIHHINAERDGVLLTPPLSSGALPGVLRASLLASGRAKEAVLWPADLQQGFYLGNALRGLLRANLL